MVVIFFCYLTRIEYLLKPFFDNFWIIAVLYTVYSFILISYTNPSFYFTDNSVLVKYPILFRWKDFELNYNDIELATFRHELFETKFLSESELFTFVIKPALFLFIPPEYKWMQIKTYKTKRTLYCFGLEFDYFSNHDDIRFETLKLEFARRGVRTLWTETDGVGFEND